MLLRHLLLTKAQGSNHTVGESEYDKKMRQKIDENMTSMRIQSDTKCLVLESSGNSSACAARGYDRVMDRGEVGLKWFELFEGIMSYRVNH